MAKCFPSISKKFTIAATAAFLGMMYTVAIPTTSLFSREAQFEQSPQDFTSVAKKAIPAVVSIKVKSAPATKRTSSNPWGYNDDDSSDLFNDDFFQRFFGLPRQNSKSKSSDSQVVGQASGFIVTADGTVLTNNHVVDEAKEVIVTLHDGREFPAKVIGQDPNTDIAVIKIDAKDLPFITLGNSDNLEVGQRVAAIGNPLGLQATLTSGVVSATGRNNLDLTRWEDYIQTDAAINRGNSGGPLLNLNAQVVGMNTAIVTDMGSGGYMGIGFAIPSNMLKHVMEELIATGTVNRGYLGVVLQQMDGNLANAFHLSKIEGALVAEISKGSPAEKAGLKQGDVILQYNKQSFNNVAGLRNAIAMMKPGTHVTLNVQRDGKVIDVPIDIGTFPTEPAPLAVAETKENKYGFGVQNLTPELSQALGYKDEKGVVISKVEPGSPAGWAGLKKGTLIVAVNKKKVSSVDEFNKEVETTEKGKPVLLLVKQGESVRFISLQLN